MRSLILFAVGLVSPVREVRSSIPAAGAPTTTFFRTRILIGIEPKIAATVAMLNGLSPIEKDIVRRYDVAPFKYASSLSHSLEFKVWISSLIQRMSEETRVMHGVDHDKFTTVGGAVFKDIFLPRVEACQADAERCGVLRSMLSRSSFAMAMFLKFGLKGLDPASANALIQAVTGEDMGLSAVALNRITSATVDIIHASFPVPSTGAVGSDIIQCIENPLWP